MFPAPFRLLLIAIVAVYSYSHAQEFDLYTSGFVSQGFLISSGNHFLVDKSKEGSFELNETGIVVQANPSNQLRVGIQLLARDLGEEGNNQVFVDWAMGDYHWRDYLGIRAGKIKLPLGLYNQGRDIDMLRTSILLPQSVYVEDQRDFVLAQEGISLYGNLPLRGTGYFDYEVYCGTLNVPNPSKGFWGNVFDSNGLFAANEIRRGYATQHGADTATATIQFLGSYDEKVQFPVVYGGAFTWSPSVPGLRLGTTWFFGEFDMSTRWQYALSVTDSNGTLREFTTQVTFNNEFHIDQIASFSVEYIWNRFTTAAEYNTLVLDQGLGHANREDGFYAMGSYRINSWLTCGSYYSVFHANSNDRNGNFATEQGLPAYLAWERDLVFNARVDLSDHWLVKAEYHYLDGVALREDIRIFEDYQKEKLVRYWNALLLKTTVHF